jgi:Inhibitor of sigma-G Gin
MDLLIKEIDKNENKCMICRNEIYSDIIINKSLLCYKCYDYISLLSVDDFEYNYYKNKIKVWIKKYNLNI